MNKNINIPLDLNCEFTFTVEKVEYTISMIYKEESVIKWYIRVKWEDNDTYYVPITATPSLFPFYKNTMPHCFYCKTKNGFNPIKENSFDSIKGDSNICICSWDVFNEELLWQQ